MTWLARCSGLSYVNRQVRRPRSEERICVTNSNRGDDTLAWSERIAKPGKRITTTHNLLADDGVQKIFGDPPSWLTGAIEDSVHVESVGEF